MPLRPGPKSPDAPPARPAPAGQGRRRFWLKGLAIAFAVLLSAAGLSGLAAWHWLFHDMPALPDTEALWETGRAPAMEFRAADGSLIEIRGPRYGRVVALSELPPHVAQAFIAAEDRRFYEHEGMDTSAIIRALWANVRAGETVQGGSTLTQQLVKNLVLSPERSLKRKAQEIRLAQALEKRLSKDEILTLYLNRVYLGAQAYGIDAAARTYFAKPATELTLGEASLLATLPKAPSRLALDANLDGARARQGYVLAQMVEAGFITPQDADAAKAQDVTLAAFLPDPQMGYLVDLAAAQAGDILPSSAPQDLVITLSIDPARQKAAREALEAVMAAGGEAQNASQAAAVFMRPDGEILALIGGRDYTTSQFNRATQGLRQPGSAFKLFVFAAALEAGLDAFSVRNDEAVQIGKWKPANYSRGYLGPVTLNEAFARSLNTVAAQLGQEVGQDKVVALAHRFGITSPLDPVPSIALGTSEVTLIELTRAYGVLANGGRRVEPWLIARIEDTRGRLLYEHRTTETSLVYDPERVREMNAMLLGVVDDGTGRAAAIEGRDVAGKTGTSQDWRDGWFIGFTPGLIGGVWVGNDDASPMKQVTGGGLPAEVWAAVARDMLKGEPVAPLPGAELAVRLDPALEDRLIFYRDLSTAFRAVEREQEADFP